MVNLYHIYTNGATASQFKVDQVVGGVSATFLGQSSPFPNVIGSADEGVAVAYGSCFGSTGPIELLTLTYVGSGASPDCSFFEVVDYPIAVPPAIYVVDCILPTPNLLIGEGSRATVNTDGSCDCTTPIPVEETSWGQIKALYK